MIKFSSLPEDSVFFLKRAHSENFGKSPGKRLLKSFKFPDFSENIALRSNKSIVLKIIVKII